MMAEDTKTESKKILAGRLYCLLDEEVCFSDICGESDFEEYFERVLEDYSLVLKNGI